MDFFSRHPRDVSSGGDAFRHLARKTIVTAAKILDGLGIRFWISSGRLFFVPYQGLHDVRHILSFSFGPELFVFGYSSRVHPL